MVIYPSVGFRFCRQSRAGLRDWRRGAQLSPKVITGLPSTVSTGDARGCAEENTAAPRPPSAAERAFLQNSPLTYVHFWLQKRGRSKGSSVTGGNLPLVNPGG